jgi:hypothetical protein
MEYNKTTDERRLDDSNLNNHTRRKEDKENITSYYVILSVIASIIASIGIVSFIYGYNI